MNAETPPRPTRLLTCVAVFARWSLGLLLAFGVLLAAAWGGLHGWIVPRIGEYRPQLESHAGRALGVPVQIGSLSARSNGLLPAIELGDVALLDAQGRPALQLPRVIATVSPRSLLKLGFEQLYIEGAELDVRREADGRIFVAGLALGDSDGAPDAAPGTEGADWLFSQPELAIRGGTVRWSDALRGAPPLALSDVDLVLRNGRWRHALRLDATPPPEWGERFSLRGQFRAPLLATHSGAWQQWSGQLFADFTRVDVSRLNQYVDVGARVTGGHGAVRAWADVQRGQLSGGTADVALAGVSTTLGAQLEPLALRTVAGRIGGRRFADGFEVSTQGLQFLTDDGLRWPGGNLTLRHTHGDQGGQDHGELQADRLDLAALTDIASRLPLGDTAHRALATYAPEGRVEAVQASWRGPLAAPQQYQARGKVSGLALAAPLGADAVAAARVPGVRGATVEFDLNQAGGNATLAVADGALLLPGVFEDPLVPVQQLGAAVRWQRDGQRLAVQASDVRFANADAAGEARANWHTDDLGHAPGVLDLSGTLQRADGTRVHRYLPQVIPQATRHYVRDAVTAGTASQVQFRVKGDLHHMPFNQPGQGEFRIAAQVRGVTYAYVPPSLQHAQQLPWPALAGLSGELVFERSSMSVRNAAGTFVGSPQVRAQKVNVRIPNLAHTVVGVSAEVRGPLADMLALVRGSHIGELTGGALAKASATGPGALQLDLSLPIEHMDASKVRGAVTLAGNDVRFTPETPRVEGAQGAVQFTESGFTLAGVQGRALGGDVRFDGGMQPPANAPGSPAVVEVRAEGVATAQGLQQATELGALAKIARSASGSTPYTVAVGVRRGVPEVQVSTSLQGMALAVPAPLGKPAETTLPVRFQNRLTPESVGASAGAGAGAGAGAAATGPLHDELVVDLGGVGSVRYVRDVSGLQPKVLRGAIALGLGPEETPPLPAAGVAANVRLHQVDVDAWQARLLGAAPAPSAADTATAAATATPPASAADAAPAAAMQDYLPTVIALRADTITRQGRTLHRVVAGGSRDGPIWRANIDATELNGYFEYRQGSGAGAEASQGLLFARLSRLAIPQAAATQVDDMLLGDSPQPGTLPSLDIVVQDFELRGRRLGRIEIEAQNRGEGNAREWQLAKFNLVAPEATFTSSGSWARVPGPGTAEPVRRTVMNFRLDIRDSGELLARFGMDGVLRRGQGRLDGQVAWTGAPISPDYPSMSGLVHLDMASGQFLKAEPGLAKLLSVLSLQSLPRRLTLDFRDVFSEGFAFDFVRGDVRIEQGVAITNNLQMKGVNAAVLMEGRADIARETQDLHVVVVPEINAMTASLVATAINPVIGLGSFLAQVFLRGPLIQAATQQFHIDGTWDDPRIERMTRRRPAAPGDRPDASPTTATPPSGDAS